MNKRMVLTIVAVAVIVLSVVSMTRQFAKPSGQDTMGLGRAGAQAAEETSRLLNGKGRIAVIYFDPGQGGLGGVEFALRELKSKLDREKTVTLAAVERVPFDADAQQVTHVIHRLAMVDAIVLLGGAPTLRVEELAKLAKPFPKLVAVLTLGSGPTKFLLQQGVLTAAIEVDPSAPNRFVVVTTETASILDEKPAAPVKEGSGP